MASDPTFRGAATTSAREADSEIDNTIAELIATFGLAAVVARIEESCLPKNNGGEVRLPVIRWVLARIIDADDARLEADIMGLGSGLLLRQGITVRAIGKKYGRTPAAISKRVIAFCDQFGLPPSYARKSQATRPIYALRNQARQRRIDL